MTKTITITISVPDGVNVDVRAAEAHSSAIDSYWNYLSDNGQSLYAAAAAVELRDGPGYTLDAIAEELDVAYASAQSYHRNSGRTARRWSDDTGTDAPIVLDDMGYDWSDERKGMRTTYRLPEGVADRINELKADED